MRTLVSAPERSIGTRNVKGEPFLATAPIEASCSSWPAPNDAPTYVKGHFFPVGGQLRQDRDEPLDEGKLLLGQGSGRATAMVGLPGADRQIVIKATTWVPADYRARPAAGS